jgi:hypothetical protein
MKGYTTSGEMLEMIRSQIANFAGKEVAKMIYNVVTFEIYGV